MNPLLTDKFKTLHGTAPFSQIKLEHFEPAIMEGMRLEDEAIQAIINNPEEPTFQNTIQPRTSELLDTATTIFFNLISANTNDEMDELAQKLSPLLTEHANRIMLNEDLFKRVKYVYEHHGDLAPEEQTLLENVYQGFLRHGACLNAEDKKRFSALQVELSTLTLQFSQNGLKQTNAFQLHLTDKKQLSGLPQTAIEAAAQAAQEKQLEGWLITLHFPSYQPFMTYADDRELRRQLYMGKMTICAHGDEFDNRQIVQRIVNLRQEIAQLLGYNTYADYVLTRRMAQDTQHVNQLIDQLLKAYMPVARGELRELLQKARQTEGPDFTLMPWDWAYYSHKLKLERYNLDAEMLRPYFPLQKVREGVFSLATKLYGITFRKNSDIEVYHPDVEAFEVFDADGSFLAVLYADFFPRESKQSGAWMTSYLEQYTDDEGNDVRPHVSIVTNFTKPTAERPSLLTLGEIETFLHEFGHALHGMFSKVRFQSLSGTNVFWDFVELPSQFMENYAVEPEFLHTFAFHYQTGEPIPTSLIERIRKSRNFMCGYACVRQLSFCLLDMAYYTRTEPLQEDILRFEQHAWRRAKLLPCIEGTCMSVQFSHIMSGGYSAGYYSYKWAEVLDADAFSVFLKNGIMDQQTAQRFRNEVLSKGGTEPPQELYKRFRGQEPTIDALLRRNGLPDTKQHNLDIRYLRMARIWSENSYCVRRQVGALVVKDKMIISDGYNGTPQGFENVCEDENNVSKPYVLHAEANAITKIARSGNNSDGSTLYVTDSPCIECAKLIIQAGIKRVIYDREYRILDGVDLLRRAGIEVINLPISEEGEKKDE